MKRRKFLGLFGAAATTPILPAPVLAKAAGVAPVSKASVHAAIMHAQTRSVFSVWGLAKAANMSPKQAAAVMEHLAERGILGPLQGTSHGGRWVTSKVWQTDMLAKARAARIARAWAAKTKKGQKLHFDIDLTKLNARLRTIQARHESQQPLAIA